MLKFIRSKGNQQPSAERQKLQKELYAFRKVSQDGRERAMMQPKELEKKLSTSTMKIFTRLHYKSLHLDYGTRPRFLISKTPKSFPSIKRCAAPRAKRVLLSLLREL